MIVESLVAFVLLTLAAAVYAAACACRYMISRRKTPEWYLSLWGVILPSLLAALAVGQGDLFDRQRMSMGPVPVWLLVILFALAAAVVAVLPAFGVVAVYRWRWRRSRGYEPSSNKNAK